MDITAVSWPELASVLKNKFSLSTGARRSLSDNDLAYLAERLSINTTHGGDCKPITFHRFAKVNLK
jgi:hypothetical protein